MDKFTRLRNEMYAIAERIPEHNRVVRVLVSTIRTTIASAEAYELADNTLRASILLDRVRGYMVELNDLANEFTGK